VQQGGDIDDDDVVVRTIDVVLCNQHHVNVCLLGQPLRAPWRPYDYKRVREVRYKPKTRRMEMDVGLNTHSANYNRDDEDNANGPSAKPEQLTHRSQQAGGATAHPQLVPCNQPSQAIRFNSPVSTLGHLCVLRALLQVEQPAMTCIGSLVGNQLLLVPVDMALHMRPVLNHVNVVKKGVCVWVGGGGCWFLLKSMRQHSAQLAVILQRKTGHREEEVEKKKRRGSSRL
jgi:hypothetical protein